MASSSFQAGIMKNVFAIFKKSEAEVNHATQQEIDVTVDRAYSCIEALKTKLMNDFIAKLYMLLGALKKMYPNDPKVQRMPDTLDSYIDLKGRPALVEAWYTDIKPHLAACRGETIQFGELEQKIPILGTIGFAEKAKPLQNDPKGRVLVWKYIHFLNVNAIKFHRWVKDENIYHIVPLTMNHSSLSEKMNALQKMLSDGYRLHIAIEHYREVLAESDRQSKEAELESQRAELAKLGLQADDPAAIARLGLQPANLAPNNIFQSGDVKYLLDAYEQAAGMPAAIDFSFEPGNAYYYADSDDEEEVKPVIKSAAELRSKKY